VYSFKESFGTISSS